MFWKKSLTLTSVVLLIWIGLVGAVHAEDHPSPTVDTPASELRSDLDHLLSEHVYLAIEAMRKGAEGAEDFDASTNALNENTDDLSNAIASVYGDEAGQQFNEMWSNHIGFFVDYVVATGEEDEAGKEEALDNLSQYQEEFSNFLESATGERLEADALAEGLQMHVDQLVGAFEAYVMEDYEKAYEYEREAMHHMYMVSKGLSDAITDQFPEKFDETKAVTPANDLRSELNYLLSEHAGLAVIAMQNGIDGAPDFDASANALNSNTEDLADAIASVYGDEAGQQFKEMWAAHIGNFVDYVEATGAEDEEAQQAALDALADYRQEFSQFIDTATEGRVAADGLAEGLQMHVEQLIGAFDNYVEGNYQEAYDHVREAYAHMFIPAKGLSGAFVDQFPENFKDNMPSEMPKTGLAPTETNNFTALWTIAGLLVLVAGGGYYYNRRNAEK
ncbi:LPXTG cell wall anchor domain-containing protein [Gracilibacillus massiliensis]|uniref:LPXTG cell wall anchor domain-containing protein n=1 Tax=Gracilibacillus massiliensis TaxID=1564956 RepID=UPI00071D44D9|nr:LPXTG cell wall anchor domain-containing protein [Gracilibacillus massiliensis]